MEMTGVSKNKDGAIEIAPNNRKKTGRRDEESLRSLGDINKRFNMLPKSQKAEKNVDLKK